MVLSDSDKGKIDAWKDVEIVSPEITRRLSDSTMTRNMISTDREFQVMI